MTQIIETLHYCPGSPAVYARTGNPLYRPIAWFSYDEPCISNTEGGWADLAEMQRELTRRWKGAPNRVVLPLSDGLVIVDYRAISPMVQVITLGE